MELMSGIYTQSCDDQMMCVSDRLRLLVHPSWLPLGEALYTTIAANLWSSPFMYLFLVIPHYLLFCHNFCRLVIPFYLFLCLFHLFTYLLLS